MSKTVTIPTDGMNPFVVISNGVKYVYTPGETVTVPDGVALEIEEYKRWRDKYYGITPAPFGAKPDLSQNDPNAADYVKGRTHWSEPCEVLPETTCEVIEDIGLAVLPDMAISAGDNLTVKYNGTEYKCTCADMGDGTLAFGNYGVIVDPENPVDTGEPFATFKDSGDGTLIWACAPLDGSATFTLSVIGEVHNTIPKKYLPVFGTANVYDIPVIIDDYGNASFAGYELADVFKLAKTPNTIVRLLHAMDLTDGIVLNLRRVEQNTVCFSAISFTNSFEVREILLFLSIYTDGSVEARAKYNYLSQAEVTE